MRLRILFLLSIRLIIIIRAKILLVEYLLRTTIGLLYYIFSQILKP